MHTKSARCALGLQRLSRIKQVVPSYHSELPGQARGETVGATGCLNFDVNTKMFGQLCTGSGMYSVTVTVSIQTRSSYVTPALSPLRSFTSYW